MPQLSFSIALDNSLPVPVVVGLDSTAMATQISAGKTVTSPIRVNGAIDTGSNVTGVSSKILRRLAATFSRTQTATNAAGNALVDLYWVSLSVIGAADAATPRLALPRLEVLELPFPLDVDVLVGVDVLLQCQFHIDGPARQFTLTF